MSKFIKLFKSDYNPVYVNVDKIDYFYDNNGTVCIVFAETAVYFNNETVESILLKINGIENKPAYKIGETGEMWRYKQENSDNYMAFTVQLPYYIVKTITRYNSRYIREDKGYKIEIVGIKREHRTDKDDILIVGIKPETLSFESGFVCVSPYDGNKDAYEIDMNLYNYTYYAQILGQK